MWQAKALIRIALVCFYFFLLYFCLIFSLPIFICLLLDLLLLALFVKKQKIISIHIGDCIFSILIFYFYFVFLFVNFVTILYFKILLLTFYTLLLFFDRVLKLIIIGVRIKIINRILFFNMLNLSRYYFSPDQPLTKSFIPTFTEIKILSPRNLKVVHNLFGLTKDMFSLHLWIIYDKLCQPLLHFRVPSFATTLFFFNLFCMKPAKNILWMNVKLTCFKSDYLGKTHVWLFIKLSYSLN